MVVAAAGSVIAPTATIRPVADRHVGRYAGAARAVDDRAAADEDVEVHRQVSRPRARSGMTVSATPSRIPTNASCRNVVVSW